MKSSLAGIAGIVWFILNLSQRGAAQLLEPRCRAPNSSPNDTVRASTWTVALKNETQLLCAGTLIHTRFVLTAAQCLEGQRTIIALLGANDIALPAAQVPVARALIHRSYSTETGNNNIGLAMLSRKVNYSDKVRPICISLEAARSKVEALKEFETFGWGIGTKRPRSETLLRVRIERHDRRLCGNGLDQSYICGVPSMADECGGDIGGPLSKSVTIERQTHPVQFGIVGLGLRHCEGLRLYIDVTSYADWIQGVVRSFDTLAIDVRVPQLSQDPRPPHRGKSPHPESPETEGMWLYNDCGNVYLKANILGPSFMAKGVMITHRFVLTAASELPEDVTSLRVEVEGAGKPYHEIPIDSIYKSDDIALLKLSRELPRQDPRKPICVLKKATPKESTPLPGILDINVTENRIRINFTRVPLVERLKCNADLMKPIGLTQICVQNHPTIRQDFQVRGNALFQRILLPGKSNATFALFGIVSYSSSGIRVITQVGLHTDWIASVVRDNSVE